MNKTITYYCDTLAKNNELTIIIDEYKVGENDQIAIVRIKTNDEVQQRVSFEAINEAENFAYFALKYNEALYSNEMKPITKITKQTIIHEDINL